MKKIILFLLSFFVLGSAYSQEQNDSPTLIASADSTKNDTICIDGECYKINEHNPWEHYYQLPDITVYGNRLTSLLTASTEYIPSYEITQKAESSILPVLKEQVPGLFINSQGVAGYGVSSGASGNITMRGFRAARDGFSFLSTGIRSMHLSTVTRWPTPTRPTTSKAWR